MHALKQENNPPPPHPPKKAPELVCAVKVSCIYVFGVAFKLGMKLKVNSDGYICFWYSLVPGTCSCDLLYFFLYIFLTEERCHLQRFEDPLLFVVFPVFSLSMKWMLGIYMYTSLQLCHLQYSESKSHEEWKTWNALSAYIHFSSSWYSCENRAWLFWKWGGLFWDCCFNTCMHFFIIKYGLFRWL